jgi:uncharacterized lipoprotein NlpE involved in copper resistance
MIMSTLSLCMANIGAQEVPFTGYEREHRYTRRIVDGTAENDLLYPHEDKPAEYGTAYPTCVLLAKSELTKQRTETLGKMLNPTEGDACAAGLHYASCTEQGSENSSKPELSTPTTFSGDLPCADCAGTRLAFTLRADGIFLSRRTYVGAPEGKVESFYDLGRWSLEAAGTRLVLYGGKEAPERFEVKDADALRQLDNEGGQIVSQYNSDLKRSAT